MPTKKPAAVFEVVFSGRGIYPEAVPLGTLSRILSALHTLATGNEFPEDDEGQQPTEGAAREDIQLLDVKRGSMVLRFSGKSPSHVLSNLREVGAVLRTPERIGDNVRILNPIEELSATARRLNCPILIREAGGHNGALALIKAESFHSISASIFVDGDTSLTGFVERVGGATVIKCGLRVSFQSRMLICRVTNKQVARSLGEHVYREVVVHGTARWLRNTWRIYGFEIKGVEQFTPGKAEDALEALRNAGGAAWDNIADPREFLESAT
ncbi:MAG: hypothetical protein U0793_29550 [Gemmataceae bacterium]